DPRVHAVEADRRDELVELPRRAAGAGLADERRGEGSGLIDLDRDDRFPRQIATHQQRLYPVEAARAEELPPAHLPAVDRRRVVERSLLTRPRSGPSLRAFQQHPRSENVCTANVNGRPDEVKALVSAERPYDHPAGDALAARQLDSLPLRCGAFETQRVRD